MIFIAGKRKRGWGGNSKLEIPPAPNKCLDKTLNNYNNNEKVL